MDSIADLLVRINNALRVKKDAVDMPHSRMKEGLIKILAAEGFVGRYEVLTRMNKKYLRVGLKYDSLGAGPSTSLGAGPSTSLGAGKKSVIEGMKRISTPGRRAYVGSDSVPRVRSGFGTAILSTSKGLMTDEDARQNKVGGEVICHIW